MGNPQKIKFRNLNEFFESLPEQELVLVEFLKEIVVNTIPECKEKLAYNVPFYYKNSRICYIWPASVPWGAMKEGVAFGFCNGHLMSTIELETTNQVSKQVFTSIKEIDVPSLKSQLFEAILIDNEIGKQRKAKKNSP